MALRDKTKLDARVIELTRGHVAIVDARDYEWLNQWRWRADLKHDRYLCAVRQERVRGRRFLLTMHQLIIGDVPANQRIHHVNLWGLDNRRSNLIVGPLDLGRALQPPAAVHKTSRYKGVHLAYRTRKGEPRWEASISVAGRWKYLGVYDDEVEAAEAHDLEAVRYYGESAFVNFPEKLPEYLYLIRPLPNQRIVRDEEDLDTHEDESDWLDGPGR